MTSEVCVMNKLGVVLAADSASTVRQMTNDGMKERYFKGANKIFQLSNHHPVGIMIYDSADIMNVPWEIVIKSYRNSLGDRSFTSLKGYADELFLYMEKNLNLFPETVLTLEITRATVSAAFEIIFKMTDDLDVHIANEQLNSTLTELRAADLPSNITNEVASELHEKVKAHALEQVAELQQSFQHKPFVETELLTDLAIWSVIHNPARELGSTGLVFAGYGEHDIFPNAIEYLCSSILAGKVIVNQVDEDLVVDHHRPAQIKAFAQTSMSDTFVRGLSLELFSSLMGTVTQAMHRLADDIINQTGLPPENIDNISSIIENARDYIRDDVLTAALEEHARPMRRVLGVLPIEEMAELAEMLINLQSLKEKVTRPSETVGGPVDVAVITKCEGLVWIQRKHYFNVDINSRYTQRLSTAHERN